MRSAETASISAFGPLWRDGVDRTVLSFALAGHIPTDQAHYPACMQRPGQSKSPCPLEIDYASPHSPVRVNLILVKVHISHLETFVRDGLPQSSRVSLYTLDASLRRSEHTSVTISLPPVAGPWSHILRADNDRARRSPVIFALDARFAQLTRTSPVGCRV